MNITNMKRYISMLLVLFVLTTNVLAVTEGVKPGKDVSAQDQINQTNQTNANITKETPTGTPPINIPVITPTDTTVPEPTETATQEPTETPDTPGFEIALAIASLSAIYILGRRK